MGEFAAGAAHEINNPLNAILLGARDALDSHGDPEYVAIMEKCLREVISEASRCGQIVKNLLRFANEEEADMWMCSFNDVVRVGLALCREYASAHNVDIAQELAPDLPEIRMNPTAIGQVVVNLVRNSVEACAGGGQVTVSSQCMGDTVRLSVHDDGIGIPPHVRPHIFDPFYTTRREDGGTGLGLSVVYGILDSHSAHVGVNSEEGGGTCFVVDFPRPVGQIVDRDGIENG
jgi:two-component system NtrC family sensor kinase